MYDGFLQLSDFRFFDYKENANAVGVLFDWYSGAFLERKVWL